MFFYSEEECRIRWLSKVISGSFIIIWHVIFFSSSAEAENLIFLVLIGGTDTETNGFVLKIIFAWQKLSEMFEHKC